MATARSTGGQASIRLGPAVLAVLVLVSVQQLPPIDLPITRARSLRNISIDCFGCCGPSCQCSGDCCGDTHVVKEGPDGFVLRAADKISRDRNCNRGGWLLPTVNSFSQPWSSTPRTVRLRPPQVRSQWSLEVVCRWQRPAISRSSPRGPPRYWILVPRA
jgi:hypothetical protein